MRPRAVTAGSSVKLTVIWGSLGADRSKLGRNVEDRVATVFPRKPDDHLPGLNNFPGAGTYRGDYPRRIGLELGETHQVMCGMELSFGCIHLRLSRLLGLGRDIVIGARRPSLCEKRLLAVEVIARLR